MPSEFLIDCKLGLVISRGTGVFRYEDLEAHMRRLGDDPRFQSGFNHLVDCRRFEAFDLTIADLQQMGGQSVFAAGSRRAMVVSSDLHFGLSRAFVSYREIGIGQVTMVFRDLNEAFRWLKLPEDYDPDSAGEPAQYVSES